MNQKKPDTSKLRDTLKALKQMKADTLNPGVLKGTLQKSYESIPKAPMLPVAPADFEPKNKADRRRIPARVRATFEPKRTKEA